LRCYKCKVHRLGSIHARESGDTRYRHGTNLVATGKVRKLWGKDKTHGGVRLMGFKAQYRCEDCGHVGWSRHCDMARRLKRAGFKVLLKWGTEVGVEFPDGSVFDASIEEGT